MELAAMRGLRVRRVFLHPQLTEIALAGRVTALFTEFAGCARTLGVEAGLVTHNPVMAADVLGEEIDSFAAIVAPCNPKGYKMAPSREACETFLRSDPARVFASEITAAGRVGPGRALDHIRTLGLAGALLDMRALETTYRQRGSSP